MIDAYSGADFLVRLELVNYGSITGRGPMDAAAILANSGANRISNYGTISASTETAIQLLDGVSEYAGFGNIIVNDGLITSAATYTIYVESTGGDKVAEFGSDHRQCDVCQR